MPKPANSEERVPQTTFDKAHAEFMSKSPADFGEPTDPSSALEILHDATQDLEWLSNDESTIELAALDEITDGLMDPRAYAYHRFNMLASDTIDIPPNEGPSDETIENVKLIGIKGLKSLRRKDDAVLTEIKRHGVRGYIVKELNELLEIELGELDRVKGDLGVANEQFNATLQKILSIYSHLAR